MLDDDDDDDDTNVHKLRLNTIAERRSVLSQFDTVCLECFDTVGWAAGRASGP